MGKEKKSYEVLIPKFEFREQSGVIKKTLSDSSISLIIEAYSEPDAAFSALQRMDVEKLSKEGYNLYSMTVTELLTGMDVVVQIKGINPHQLV